MQDKDLGREFRSYARGTHGLSSITLDSYAALTANYINPQVVIERQMNVQVMDVFSRLLMDRIIFLGVPIDDDVANIIQAQLLFLESMAGDGARDINMYINSPGGVLHGGLGIYDTMQYLSSDVATICTGMAASMAAVLLAAGTTGKRSALPHARVMIHQPLGGTRGQASDIEIEAREIKLARQELNEILAKHTGQSVERVHVDTDRDYWMSSKEAVEYGMIDRVMEKRS
ncbi:MAG: ClpP family protease [Bacteroides sp.]